MDIPFMQYRPRKIDELETIPHRIIDDTNHMGIACIYGFNVAGQTLSQPGPRIGNGMATGL